jgi:hypothetical protein
MAMVSRQTAVPAVYGERDGQLLAGRKRLPGRGIDVLGQCPLEIHGDVDIARQLRQRRRQDYPPDDRHRDQHYAGGAEYHAELLTHVNPLTPK